MRKSGRRLHAFAQNAEKTARRQRDIQKKVDRADKAVTRILRAPLPAWRAQVSCRACGDGSIRRGALPRLGTSKNSSSSSIALVERMRLQPLVQ
jgi:hypothetical protein